MSPTIASVPRGFPAVILILQGIAPDSSPPDDAAGRGISISPGGTEITFDSKNGTLDDLTPQNVTLLSSTGRYGLQVQISALGQARACRPSDKDTFPGFSTC